jgi:hypothetical protein
MIRLEVASRLVSSTLLNRRHTLTAILTVATWLVLYSIVAAVFRKLSFVQWALWKLARNEVMPILDIGLWYPGTSTCS